MGHGGCDDTFVDGGCDGGDGVGGGGDGWMILNGGSMVWIWILFITHRCTPQSSETITSGIVLVSVCQEIKFDI